jgi:hypothetical protein
VIMYAQRGKHPRIKDRLTDKDDRQARLAAAFIEALSAENIDRQRKHEYHQGHPTLTEAELDLMMAAEKKAGRPMRDPAHAKQVLGIQERKSGYSSVGALVMARAQKRLAEEYDDADLALNAIKLERRALEAIKLHLPELPPRPDEVAFIPAIRL